MDDLGQVRRVDNAAKLMFHEKHQINKLILGLVSL